MMYKFNQKEIKKILDSLVIIVDTRENANSHIIDFFNKKKIPYSIEKLPFGDYSCKLPAGSFEQWLASIYSLQIGCIP